MDRARRAARRLRPGAALGAVDPAHLDAGAGPLAGRATLPCRPALANGPRDGENAAARRVVARNPPRTTPHRPLAGVAKTATQKVVVAAGFSLRRPHPE